MGAFSIPLQVQTPQPRSPLTSIGALMQLRGQMSEIALRQAQVEQAKQNTADIAAQTAERQRDVSDQNQIQQIEKDPDAFGKILAGDLSPLAGKISDKTLQAVRTNVNAALQNEAVRTTEQLKQRGDAANTIGTNLGTALMTQRKPDGSLDVDKVNALLPGFIQSHAAELKALGVDPSTVPTSIADEDHLNLLASRINGFSAMNKAALEMKAKQAETAQKVAETSKAEADAAQAHAQAEHLAATLPKDKADAAIAKIQSDFAAAHGGLKPEEAATKDETARHNKAIESLQNREAAIKEKTFDATLGSGLDANGQPLSPEAMKAAALQDPAAVMIAHYQIAPPPATTRGGLPNPIYKKVAAINPQYDATTYPARAETARGFSPSGAQGQAITATDTALAHLNTLSEAGQALKNGDIQAINKVANAIGAQVGQTPKATYDTILNMVGPEISKAVIGAVGGEGERAATAANFESKLSPQQRESNIAAAVNLLNARYEKASHAYEQQMGVPLPRSLSPESQAIKQRYTQASPGAGKSVTKQDVQDYATKHGLSYADAETHVKANGFTVK